MLSKRNISFTNKNFRHTSSTQMADLKKGQNDEQSAHCMAILDSKIID